MIKITDQERRALGIVGVDLGEFVEVELPKTREEEMINLTPHTIIVHMPHGLVVEYPPSGQVARVAVTEEPAGDYAGIPVIRRATAEAQGLPEEGTPCLVSSMVLAAVPGRREVYAPDTGPTAIRDEAGRIVAVTRLVAAAPAPKPFPFESGRLRAWADSIDHDVPGWVYPGYLREIAEWLEGE